MGNKYMDLTGKKFGRFTVLEVISITQNNRKRLFCVCECECGTIKTIRRDVLMCNDSLSCGCIQQDKVEKRNRSLEKFNELFEQGIIPCGYVIEREPDLIIKRIIKFQKISREQAIIKYKEWRKDYRKGVERNIC